MRNYFLLPICLLYQYLIYPLMVFPEVLSHAYNHMLHIPWYTLLSSKRSEEHTSELQSRENLVCRLLLEKKKKRTPCTSRPNNKPIRNPRSTRSAHAFHRMTIPPAARHEPTISSCTPSPPATLYSVT